MRLSAIFIRIIAFSVAAAGSVAAAQLTVATVEDRSVDAVRQTLAENGHDWANVLGDGLQVIIEGTAPDALQDLPAPDSIFVGGGASSDGVVDACWSALKPGGHLVANCVTLEGEAELLRRLETLGGDLIRLAVSRAEPVGPYHGWRPLMPVTQWRIRKPMESTS